MCEFLHSLVTESECKLLLGNNDKERKNLLRNIWQVRDHYPGLNFNHLLYSISFKIK